MYITFVKYFSNYWPLLNKFWDIKKPKEIESKRVIMHKSTLISLTRFTALLLEISEAIIDSLMWPFQLLTLSRAQALLKPSWETEQTSNDEIRAVLCPEQITQLFCSLLFIMWMCMWTQGWVDKRSTVWKVLWSFPMY